MGEWLLSRGGQADSSQARSAWAAIQAEPRPRGMVEVIVKPTRERERAKGVGHGQIIS